jgi:hypothetical protein
VGVQVVNWNGGSTKPAGKFSCGKCTENHELGTGSSAHMRIISAVKRIEFVSDRVSHITLSGTGVISLFMHQQKITMIFQRIASTRNWKTHSKSYKNFVRRFQSQGRNGSIFKLRTGNESLYEISNDSGVRAANFATSKNLTVKSTMFPHCNIHKVAFKSPKGKTHNEIDHILIDVQRHSSALDI